MNLSLFRLCFAFFSQLIVTAFMENKTKVKLELRLKTDLLLQIDLLKLQASHPIFCTGYGSFWVFTSKFT